MTSVMGVEPPISHLDPYSDPTLIDPWPIYTELQDAGPAVWLSKYEMFALTRYDSVWKALQDPASFPSSLGVMMNDHMNQVRGNTLCSDGEDHIRQHAYGFVAYEGDRPVSTATAIINQGCLFLFLVATATDARRKGYGEAVVRHALQTAHEATGIRRTVLHATESGYPVYLRLGYHPTVKLLES
jgi:GNAT superfamily N-acetyltransferase